MRLNLRVALLLLIGLVAIGGVWSGFQAPGPAKGMGATDPAHKSATLVIDFGAKSGREVKVLKVENLKTDATGWDLLIRSGATVKGTSQYPTGFVCRIDGWPKEDSQTCQDTPAFKDGHWAYFVTSKKFGKDWMLSGQGAATHVADCGEYEGWKWVGPSEAATPPSVAPEVGDCQR
jgi:hypothetical protein